jgi:putative tricarboxylic transport membrane protein
MRVEQIISLSLALMGTAIAFGGVKLGLGKVSMPGPGFFPLVAGLALTVFAGIVLWDTMRKSRKAEIAGNWRNVRWRHILLTFFSLLAYSNLIEALGFIVSTVLVLMVLFRSYESEKWLFTILKSVLTSTVFYVFFEKIFQLNLPQGIWGF